MDEHDERPLPIEAPAAGGRRWKWGLGIVGVLLLTGLCLVLGVVAIPFAWVAMMKASIEEQEAALRSPAVAVPVARALALYAQSDPSLFPARLGRGWLPAELAAVAPHAHGTVRHLEVGGGFHHFGYRLGADPTPAPAGERGWRLYLYRDGAPDALVASVRLAANARLSKGELFALLMKNHDALIARRPADVEERRQKLDTCGRFGEREEGRRLLADMVRRFPDDWWCALVNALLLAETDPAAAEAGLRAWVDGAPDFFRWLDLAYYHQLRGEPAKAAAAAQRATQHDAETARGHGTNSEHRGYSAARYAYETGHFDVAIALCDHLLPVKVNGTYAKAPLQRLRDAAAAARTGGAPAKAGLRGLSAFDPFGSANSADVQFDLDALLGRKVARPTWRDE